MRVSTYASVNGRSVEMSPMVIISIVSGIFLLVGAAFAAIGIALSNSQAKLEAACTESVTAVVIRYKTSSDGLESPVYEYEYNGTKHSYSSNAYSSDPPYRVGDKAELMVNPDKPQQAYAPADKTTGSLGKVFTFMGFGFMIVAVLVFVIFWAAVRSEKRQEQKKEEPWEM